MTNCVALPVCVTEILIYCLIEPFPAFPVKLICIRAFDDHFTIRISMPIRSLIKRNGFIVNGALAKKTIGSYQELVRIL